MWVKRLRLEGFKSFGDENTIEFHRHINVVLGKNGSGKSNLFSAISLLLNASVVSSREKVHLIHDVGGARARHHAAIEITFDNSDGRFPILSGANKTELVIKRVIGAKIDMYSINSKPATRDEVISLMEAAGFSRNNPFYLVEQGQVSELANCSESRRLNVVQDVAGLSSFEVKKANATAELRDAKRSYDYANKELDALSGELNDLKAKEEDMKKVVEAREEKLALEFVRNEKSVAKFQRRLAETTLEKDEAIKSYSDNVKRLEVKKVEKNKANAEVEDINEELSTNNAKRIELQERIEMELKKDSKLASKLDQLELELKYSSSQRKDWEGKLHELDKRVILAEKELVSLNEEWRAAERASCDASDKLRIKQKLQSNMFTLRTTLENFETEAEVKEFINSEISKVEVDISAKLTEEKMLQEQKNEIMADEEKIRTHVSGLKEALENHIESTSEAIRRVAEMEEKVSDIATREMNCRRNLLDDIESLRDAKKAVEEIRFQMSKDRRVRPFIIGAQSMQEVLSKNGNQDGFHGFVGELFENDGVLDTAISVVLGPRLYHMVVETAALAHRLLKEMRYMNLPGEVSFLVMDKQQIWPLPELRRSCKNATPLLGKINGDQKFSLVFQSLFGQQLLVRDMKDFSQFRGTRWNCVTLDGQQKFFTGVLKGGLHPAGEESNLCLFRRYVEKKEHYNQLTKTKISSERQLADLEIELKKGRDDVTFEKSKIDRLKRRTFEVRRDESIKLKEMALIRCRIEEITSDLNRVKVDLQELNQTRTDLHAKLTGKEYRITLWSSVNLNIYAKSVCHAVPPFWKGLKVVFPKFDRH